MSEAQNFNMVSNQKLLPDRLSSPSTAPFRRRQKTNQHETTKPIVSILVALFVGGLIGLIGLYSSPWLALTAAIGMGLLLLFLVNPQTVCYMLIGAIVLTSGMERGLLVALLKPNELAFLLAVGVALLVALSNSTIKVSGGNYLLFSVCFLGIGTFFMPLVTYIQRGADLTTYDYLSLIAPLQYFLLFWTIMVLIQRQVDQYRLVLWMIVAGAFVAVVGLLQAAEVSMVQQVLDVYYPSSHGSAAEEAGRVTSLFGAWNATGIYLMTTTLLGWGFLPSVKSGRDRLIVVWSTGLSVLGLLATGSFAGIGALAIGFLLFTAIQSRGWRIIPMLLFTIVLVAVLLYILQPIVGPLIEQRLDYQFGGRRGQEGWIPQTLSFRFNVWRELFWPAIRENFLWGTHPTIPEGFGWHAYESQYIYLLFATGAVGFVSWLMWWFGSLLWFSQHISKLAGPSRSLGAMTLVLLIVMGFAGLTNAVFTFAGSVDYLWILLAITANNPHQE